MADDINFEVTGFGELRKQLREAQLEMIKLAEAGKSGTAEFAAAARKAGEIKEAIGDAADAATVFADGGKFKAVGQGLGIISSGFGAIKGAISLAGGEAKDFEKTMVTLQTAIAFTSFFESFAEMSDIFKKLKLAAVDTFTAIKGAIGSTGIGLLVVALGTLVYYWEEIAAAIGLADEEQKDYAITQDQIIAKTGQEQASIESLIKTIKNQKLSYAARQEALEDLKKIMPGITQLDLNSKDAIDKLSLAQTSYVKVLKARAEAELQTSAYVEAQKALIARQAKGLDVGSFEDVKTFLQAMFTLQDVKQARLNASSARYGAELTVLYDNLAKVEEVRDKAYQDAAQAEAEYNRLVGLGAGGKEKKPGTDDAKKKAQQKKVAALDAQKDLDLALLEQQKLFQLQQDKTDEERAMTEQKYLEMSLNRQAKYEIDREDLRDKDEKNAVQLQAKLQALDNQSVKAGEDLSNKLTKIAQDKAEKLTELEKKRLEDFKNTSAQEYEDTKKNLDKYYNEREIAIRNEGLSEKELAKKLEALEKEKLESRKIAAQDYVATVEQAGFDVVEIELEISKQITDIDKKTQEEKIKNFQEYADTVIQGAQAVTDAFAAQLDMQQQKEIESIKASSKNEEEKAKAIDDVKRKYFEKNKSIEIANAIISTISGALNAFVSTLKIDPTGITGSILAAAALATGYFQVEKIKATTYESSISGGSKEQSPQGSMYAEGGLLMGRSHNLGGIKTSMGQLEGGEFVMNRRATANFLPLLQAINAQGNTAGPEIPQYQQNIIKTYVVASDMTSQQEAAAKLNALARL